MHSWLTTRTKPTIAATQKTHAYPCKRRRLAHQYLICCLDSVLSAVKLTTTTYTDVGHARPPSIAPRPLNRGKPPYSRTRIGDDPEPSGSIELTTPRVLWDRSSAPLSGAFSMLVCDW